MRDLLVTLIVFVILPLAVWRPSLGVLAWVWISVMNPHRLSWGFAYDFPFAMMVAIATLFGVIFSKEPKRFIFNSATVCLIMFIFWMNMTSLFAINPDQLYHVWSTIMKVLAMTLVAIMVLHSKEHIRWLVWMLVISIGFYGTKGGIFTLLSGGSYTVWGPAGSFIEENNALALALIMMIPLMRYLQMTEPNVWVRRGLLAAMLLCGFSAVGSYSRGALIAILASAIFLWWKSPRKMVSGVAIAILLPLLFAFMPAKWEARMNTIGTYQQDASAMGRINAWEMAWNLALDRPLTGGGFEIYDKNVFSHYAPNPQDVHAAHSIYFQVLGEHGFPGLIFFLGMGFFTWRNGSWIIARTKDRRDLSWANALARMLHVSQVAYATGGAFLSLAYFDLPYYVLVLMVLTKAFVKSQLLNEKPLKLIRQKPA